MVADFSGEFWIREPVIDGKTKLNRAMELLGQCRDEITAIETVLGTGLKGSSADLATRLATRISPSGILRGQVYALRGPNADPTSLFSLAKWRTGGNTYVQFGQSALISDALETITFTRAYFTGLPPAIVIAQYGSTANSGHPLGDIQVARDQITITNFKVRSFHFFGAGGSASWAVADTSTSFRCTWIALGGFPS